MKFGKKFFEEKRNTILMHGVCILLLVFFVIVISLHMFSYFLRLAFRNPKAADEFLNVMEIVRGRFSGFDSLVYFPSALLVKISKICIPEVKLYKTFILSNILLNVLVICLFYIFLTKAFKNLSKMTLFFITSAFYFGVPAYCFLYGGYMSNVIYALLIVLTLFWSLYAFRKKINLQWNGSVFLKKIIVLLNCAFIIKIYFSDFMQDFIYFIPCILIVIWEAFWKEEISKFFAVIYQVITVVILIMSLLMKNYNLKEEWKITILCIYWTICWILTIQAVCIAREKRYFFEVVIYGMFLLILLILQVFDVQGQLKSNQSELVADVKGSGSYFYVYNYNARLLKADYIDDDDIFFGSSEFIDLAEKGMSYPKDEILLLADENTITDKTWFVAITDQKSVQMDGLNSTEEEILSVLKRENPAYVILFTNSRIYMLHYEFILEYPCIYENERGMILQRPVGGW